MSKIPELLNYYHFSICHLSYPEKKNCLYLLLTLKVYQFPLITSEMWFRIRCLLTSTTSSNTLSSQMLWPTWPWSPQLTSPASLTLPSLASTGSGVLPTLIWTSPETTKSSFYPNLPILNCTKGETRCWRLETFETLSILASSIVNPHRRFPHRSESPWSTTLTEVSVSPVQSTHQEVGYVSHLWCLYSVPRSQFRPGSSYVDC